jgi:hypothetical protein
LGIAKIIDFVPVLMFDVELVVDSWIPLAILFRKRFHLIDIIEENQSSSGCC